MYAVKWFYVSLFCLLFFLQSLWLRCNETSSRRSHFALNRKHNIKRDELGFNDSRLFCFENFLNDTFIVKICHDFANKRDNSLWHLRDFCVKFITDRQGYGVGVHVFFRCFLVRNSRKRNMLLLSQRKFSRALYISLMGKIFFFQRIIKKFH